MVSKAYILDEQVGFLMRIAGQRHSAIFQQHVPLDLTPPQFSVLIKVLELGSCSQNELGRRTAMDVATIKGVVDRLRTRKLVTVRSDLKDKRRSVVELTEETKSYADLLKQAGLLISDLTLDPLTTTERDLFLKLLKKLCS
jgi:DNA-binding MarR family transcriptional regulator